jgi:hypothetical protein
VQKAPGVIFGLDLVAETMAQTGVAEVDTLCVEDRFSEKTRLLDPMGYGPCFRGFYGRGFVYQSRPRYLTRPPSRKVISRAWAASRHPAYGVASFVSEL